MGSARCNRCGSYKVRRSHSRTRLQKLLRATGLFDRYACGSCGHRGWTWDELPPRSEAVAPVPAAAPAPGPGAPASTPAPTTGGRRLERRDHRLKRRTRLRATLAVALSLLLGVLTAQYLQRCDVAPPTATE